MSTPCGEAAEVPNQGCSATPLRKDTVDHSRHPCVGLVSFSSRRETKQKTMTGDTSRVVNKNTSLSLVMLDALALAS